jgi:hypothetical protein
MATTQGFVILTLRFWQEDRRWVGECAELGTSTYGRTLRQAHDELKELVLLHLNSLEQVGEREHFFRKHNIKFYTDTTPTEVPYMVPVDAEFYTHVHRFPVSAPA